MIHKSKTNLETENNEIRMMKKRRLVREYIRKTIIYSTGHHISCGWPAETFQNASLNLF